MADSAGKRSREAKKRRKKEIKAERKRMRKEGLLVGIDPSAPTDLEEPITPLTNPPEP